MSWAGVYLDIAIIVSVLALLISFALVGVRLYLGPSLPDRVLGLDMLVTIAVAFIAVFAIRTGQHAYLDVAISLGLVGFLATTAFSRYILSRGLKEEEGLNASEGGQPPGEDGGDQR